MGSKESRHSTTTTTSSDSQKRQKLSRTKQANNGGGKRLVSKENCQLLKSYQESMVAGNLDDQMKYLTLCYPVVTQLIFGNNTHSNEKQLDKLIMPLEIMLHIMDFCDQTTLQSFSKTCKFVRNLMKLDLYYWPQTVKIHNYYSQFTKYLSKGAGNELYFLHDLRGNSAQKLGELYESSPFPLFSIFQKKAFKMEDNSIQLIPVSSLDFTQLFPFSKMDWSNMDENTVLTGSSLCTEEYMTQNYLFNVDFINLLLDTLFHYRRVMRGLKYQQLVRKEEECPMRCIIRDYRTFFESHPRLKLLLKSREGDNYSLNIPLDIEKDESDLPKKRMNDDDTLKKNSKEIPVSDIGKVVAYECACCSSKVSGFTCIECNELMVIDSTDGHAICPSCRKTSISRPNCCSQPMRAQYLGWEIAPKAIGPTFRCQACSSKICLRCFACCTQDNQYQGSPIVVPKPSSSPFFSCKNDCMVKSTIFNCKNCNQRYI